MLSYVFFSEMGLGFYGMVGSSRDNNKKENHHSSNDLMLSKSSHVILVCAPYSCSYVKKTYATDTGGQQKLYTLNLLRPC